METGLAAQLVVDGEVASIEPRLFSRGNDVGILQIVRLRHASIEPRLFSRGNVEAKPVIDRVDSASIEPRLFSRGNGHGHDDGPGRAHASIEPRLFSRGNDPPNFILDAIRQASIEPRLFSRGNRGRKQTCRLRPLCFNRATTFQPWKLCSSGVNTPRLTCFNRATTFQPWKRREWLKSRERVSRLQ